MIVAARGVLTVPDHGRAGCHRLILQASARGRPKLAARRERLSLRSAAATTATGRLGRRAEWNWLLRCGELSRPRSRQRAAGLPRLRLRLHVRRHHARRHRCGPRRRLVDRRLLHVGHGLRLHRRPIVERCRDGVHGTGVSRWTAGRHDQDAIECRSVRNRDCPFRQHVAAGAAENDVECATTRSTTPRGPVDGITPPLICRDCGGVRLCVRAADRGARKDRGLARGRANSARPALRVPADTPGLAGRPAHAPHSGRSPSRSD